jgi:hypothetical protein
MILRAELIFVSKFPMKKVDLEIFSIGGFSSITPDGRTLCFDWDSSASGVKELENGHIEITCDMREFNEEDFVGCNLKEGIKEEEVTPDFIINSELTEVFYEAFANEVEDPLIPLVLKEFTLWQWNDEKQDYDSYSFTDEALEKFEREHALHVELAKEKS